MARCEALCAAVLLALYAVTGAQAATTTFAASGSGNGTAAKFNISLPLDPNVAEATITVTLSDVPDYFMSHLHLGNSTTSGPVVLWVDPISPALLPDPQQYQSIRGLTFTYTFNASGLVGPLAGDWPGFNAALAAGDIYFNVHTKEAPEGLVRQSLRAAAPAVFRVFFASLGGSSQQPGSNATARGNSTLTFSPDMQTATVALTLQNIRNFTMAQVRLGNATTSGRVLLWLQPLAAPCDTDDDDLDGIPNIDDDDDDDDGIPDTDNDDNDDDDRRTFNVNNLNNRRLMMVLDHNDGDRDDNNNDNDDDDHHNNRPQNQTAFNNTSTRWYYAAPPRYTAVRSLYLMFEFDASSLVGPLAGARNLTALQELARNGQLYADVQTKEQPRGALRAQYNFDLVA